MKFIIDKNTFVVTQGTCDRRSDPVIAISGLHPYGRWNHRQKKIALDFLMSFIDPNEGKWSWEKFQQGKKYRVTITEVKD